MSKTPEDRVIFTKEMKATYKILLPMMLPIHFELIRNCLLLEGYDAELLYTNHRGIVDEGLSSVHNDTCYPALLVIGQLMDALKSGKYDLNKTALMITQTGGGCRASNYIHLLRKAMKKHGLGHIPVISLNLSGMEKNPGFKLTLPLIKKMIYSCLYGDIITNLANQTRPYELIKGETDRLTESWCKRLLEEYKNPKNIKLKHVKENFREIVIDFTKIKVNRVPKVKVGIVGEIYVKYAPLGNNNLEEFLRNENCEVVVPGLLDFVIFKVDNRIVDSRLYKRKFLTAHVARFLENFLLKCQDELIAAIRDNSNFRVPASFNEIKALVKGYLGYGNKMGEGWLLTGEMLELIHAGIPNIVCTQPFGCLPNHVAGKGMIRKIKDNNPKANIVAIDYDPGATKVNQENRIKLMLSAAMAELEKENTKTADNSTNKSKEKKAVLL